MKQSDDPIKRANSLKALADNRDPLAATKHGVFPFIRSGVHPCNKCVKRDVCPLFKKDSDCAYLADFQKSVEDSVMDLDFIEEHDRPLAHLLAKEMSILALCEMYFAEEGLIIHDKRKKKLETQPLVSTYNNFMRSVKQTMAALGLGPSARSRLKLEQADAIKKLTEVGMDDGQEGSLDFLND